MKLIKKVKGCDSKKSNLSTLCTIYIVLLVFHQISILMSTLNTVTITNDSEVIKGAIIDFVLNTLLVFTPVLVIIYKMCRYKCQWLHFILYLILLTIVFRIVDMIKSYIIFNIFPKFKITTILLQINRMNGTNAKYETINFDKDTNYIECILEDSGKKTIKVLTYELQELFVAEFETNMYKSGDNAMKSTNFVSDENYIAVADIQGELQVYDKKTNEKYNYRTSDCNAVAIGYYDHTFTKDVENKYYDHDTNTYKCDYYKKDDIYTHHVLVYNDGSKLYARAPVIPTNDKPPIRIYDYLELNANIDRITLMYNNNISFIISVVSNDKETTIVEIDNDNDRTLKIKKN